MIRGVVTSIGTKEGAQAAFNRIVTSVKEYNPKAKIEGGVIIEEQAKPGLELIIGGKTDPTFGKVITFGIGGTLVELMKDVTLRILPATEEDVREMVKEIRSYPLISGYRGSKPKDEETLVQAILNVCKFFEENKQVKEFDINPLRLYESGACAVDSRIILRDINGVQKKEERPDVPPLNTSIPPGPWQ